MRKNVSKRLLRDGDRGASHLELAILLPLIVVMAFGVIDLGRLIHARLVVTNVSREGGSLASRDIQMGDNLVALLQSSASPFDLATQGRIYVTRIKAGTSLASRYPYIESRAQGGSYNVSSSIGGERFDTPTGFLRDSSLWNHLIFEPAPQNTSDIAQITVVEVFYHYRPITPLPRFAQNLFPDNGGIVIGSRAIY